MSLVLRTSTGLPCISCLRQLGTAGPSNSTRSFSATATQNNRRRPTKARRGLWYWITQQGGAFLNPIPNNTNYLGAYAPNGKMRRVMDRDRKLERKRTSLKEKLEEETKKPRHERDDAAFKNLRVDSENIETEIEKQKDLVPPPREEDNVPFPSNPLFVSQPVLDDTLRDRIVEEIDDGIAIREVSQKYSVDMRRIAAVYRLKAVERAWKAAGKEIAEDYHNTVMGMLPKTPGPERRLDGSLTNITPHESINDLPIHKATEQQIFLPVAESRVFTRADAAKAFHHKLLPADERVPHPEIAIMKRQELAGYLPHEREAWYENYLAKEKARLWKKAKKLVVDENRPGLKIVQTPRFEFRIQEVNVEAAGKDGRGAKGVGYRYGMPLMDHKRGDLKIPSKV